MHHDIQEHLTTVRDDVNQLTRAFAKLLGRSTDGPLQPVMQYIAELAELNTRPPEDLSIPDSIRPLVAAAAPTDLELGYQFAAYLGLVAMRITRLYRDANEADSNPAISERTPGSFTAHAALNSLAHQSFEIKGFAAFCRYTAENINHTVPMKISDDDAAIIHEGASDAPLHLDVFTDYLKSRNVPDHIVDHMTAIADLADQLHTDLAALHAAYQKARPSRSAGL